MDEELDDIVLVTVDSLRADHCGFMGCEKPTTPTLDTFAEDGLVFENAIAPGPSTSESVPAILTGHYPVPRPNSQTTIDERIDQIAPHMEARTNLAQRMSSLGYRTAAFTPNPFTSRYFGYGNGFDKYQDFLDGSRNKLYERFLKGTFSGSRLYMPVRIMMNWFQREEAFKPWSDFYNEIIEWTNQSDEPYFIWIFLMDAHHPYLPSEDHRSISKPDLYYANWKLRYKNYEPPLGKRAHQNLVQSYCDSIKYVDEFVDRITRDLADDDPTIIFTSDHGESFGEHGTYEHHGGAFGQNGEQEYHSYLYEENIHVPLLIINSKRAGRVEEPVSLRSLSKIVVDEAVGRNETAYGEKFVTSQSMNGEKIAVRGRRYKYIQTNQGSKLYDLQKGEDAEIDNDVLHEQLARIAAISTQTDKESTDIVKAGFDVASKSDL
ncbi:sulfatase [Haloarchaeobius sp. HME9146]|uniref:sulfatase n=1 Tax=Haloarchaeobius sp. HME9146 TaxID=2978732 RepID=UPI0021BF500E|nr:sulfatase [Haloarchaeobius sp. HME9146]MCT9097023.1 sulfatase [Haloarchaeobius sp. HME9146]